MSDPAEQHRGSALASAKDRPSDRVSRVGNDVQDELARLHAEVERLLQERVMPLPGSEDQTEVTTSAGGLPGAFDDAMDELMGGFDVRLAEVNRRLDRVLERRR